MTISPLGDSAVVIAVGDPADPANADRIHALADAIARRPPAGVVDVVPAFASIAVFFEPTQSAAFETLRAELTALALAVPAGAATAAEARTVEVPVCYGGEFGADLEHVAAHARLTPAEVVALHSGAAYRVQAIGFAPGFPYLGGLPPVLATPRRASPRPRVPAGSVGIGGTHTGLYPLATAGGWNLVGRTPLPLFDANLAEPTRLRAGDRVTFRAIDAAEFARLRGAADEAAACERVRSEPAGAAIEVVRAGMFTTVQDLGRGGQRARGVALSGGADRFALRLANLLVGNAETAAALEFTLVGPELRFTRDTVVALGGAEFDALPRWRPVAVAAGTTLRFGPARRGSRGYLAIAGGIDVPPVLGSRSTLVSARLGGFGGRILRDGDALAVTTVTRHFRDHWRIDERIVPPYSSAPVVRAIPGAHAERFGPAWREKSYRVSPRSDRMGVRLEGVALRRGNDAELVSSPVAPGTVQVPPDGRPIVLLADAQTIGGYPQLAHVVAVDLPLVAQLRPGDALRFQIVTLDEARGLALAQERALALLREGLAEKLA